MATLTKDDILDAISSMTVLELSELLSAFEEKFGVTAAAPVAVAAAGAGAGAAPAEAVEEKDEFDVVLVRRRRPEDPGHQGGARAHQAWASRRPRTSSTPPPSRCSRRSARKTPRRPSGELEAAGAVVEVK